MVLEKKEAISVFSNRRLERENSEKILLPDEILVNGQNSTDGLYLLSKIPYNIITSTFFDPQYRDITD